MTPFLSLATLEQQHAVEWSGAAGGWGGALMLAALAGVCVLVWRLYRREGRGVAGARLRGGLAVMRCAALVLLALVFLNPVMATYTLRTTRATVAVLIDESTSMSIPDAGASDASRPRIERVAALLRERDRDWLRRLAARNDVSVFAFGDDATRLDLPSSESSPTGFTSPRDESSAESSTKPADTADTAAIAHRPLREWLAGPTARSAYTDLSCALEAVSSEAAQRPIAAIVVLTDGNFNRGASVDEVALAARRLHAPLRTIGVGDEVEPPNVRVTSLAAPASVAKGDPLELRASVVGAGAASGDVEVQLFVFSPQDSGATGRALTTRRVTLPADAQPADVRFAVDAGQAGEYVYRVRVTPLPGEASEEDNERSASVLVLDHRLRVLLLAGRPTYDYRALLRLFERDKTLELSCWLQSADPSALRDGTTPIRELPRKPEELFAYDVILMLDPDPRELDASWAINVRRFVDEFGGGLLLQAGASYTSRFLREARLSELTSILPVAPDPDADMRMAEQGSFRNRATPLIVPEALLGHPLLSFGVMPTESRAVWTALGTVWWSYPVQRAKPVATVLMREGGRGEGDDAPPLLAVQPFGAGRVGFLGMDHTWRWRSTGERYFDRFWVQMVRFLSQARREGASRRGTIVLDQDRVQLGESLRIEARVLDESFMPWQAGDVTAEIALGDGQTRELSLSAIAGREGWFGGRIRMEIAGPATIRVPLPRAAVSTAPAADDALVKHVQVERSDAELTTLRLQREALERLAAATGGSYVPLADAGRLPDEIESATQTDTIEGPRRELWDRA